MKLRSCLTNSGDALKMEVGFGGRGGRIYVRVNVSKGWVLKSSTTLILLCWVNKHGIWLLKRHRWLQGCKKQGITLGTIFLTPSWVITRVMYG